LLHASANLAPNLIHTASILRLTTMSRLHRADMPDRCVSTVPAIWSIKSSTSARRNSAFGLDHLFDPLGLRVTGPLLRLPVARCCLSIWTRCRSAFGPAK
jgi:hypothetical protein